MRKIVILILLMVLSIFAYRYAIVVSNATYSISDWRAVCDSLRLKHQGRIFIYTSSIYDILNQLQEYQPDYICFVGRPVSEVNRQFVRDCHQLTRELDDDIYGDAVWGIITGYTAGDALRLTRYDTLWVRTVLGGTNCTWDYWIEKGISTYEAEYNRIKFKFPNGTTLDTLWPERCPTDRCTLLVNYLNNGINDTVPNRPRIVGNVDIFVTSGHASQWEWQLHYPGSGYEGFFRSYNGQLRGDPYSGSSRNINSFYPKLYFAVGNCLIGDVADMNCMVLAWFHTGGAIQMTGYIVETWYGYMLWGLPAYYHYLQGRTTYAQAFYLNNQSLLFDQINNTPGTNPSGLEYDKNNVAFYGDPACQTRIYPIREPYYSENIEIRQGTLRDTFIITITANYDSSTLGFTGPSGTRHPIVFLPVRIESIQVENTNAHSVVITDNFCLLYVWYQGQRKFVRGETRYVRFTAKRKQVSIKEISLPIIKRGIQKEKIKGEIYDVFGRKVKGVIIKKGIYFVRENKRGFKVIKI